MAVKGRDIALRAASAAVLAPAAVAATWFGGVWFLALVVVAASSGGTYLYVSQHGMAAEAVTVEPVAQKPQAPRLVTIAPMTVNLVNERDEQSLLYVGFALEVADDATQALLQQYMPQIRSQLLTLLSGQNTTPLRTQAHASSTSSSAPRTTAAR